LQVRWQRKTRKPAISDELGESSPDTPEAPVNDINISGQVSKCSDGTPFQGATVTVTDYEKEVSTTTNTMGQYQLNFQSTNTNFMVTATAPGHNPESQEIILENGDNTYNANFQLGMDDVYVATWGSDDTGTGEPGNPYRTIAKGVLEVNHNGNIHVEAGTYYEALTINKNLNLICENQDTTIIDGNNTFRPLTIYSTTFNINNFTIQNGRVTSTVYDGGYAEAHGGGIYIGTLGTVNMNNCTIQNNTLTATAIGFDAYAEAYGGGILSRGTLNINNSTKQNNSATSIATQGRAYVRGGEIYGGSGTITIYNGKILNNTINASAGSMNANAEGGGVYISDTDILIITESRIQNNTNNATGGIPYLKVEEYIVILVL